MPILQPVDIAGQRFYKLADSDQLRPFFMSVVSDGNHWLFVASNGGLTAGRKDAEYALFPYYTDDKVTEGYETTGPKTIIRTGEDVWEPFSDRDSNRYRTTRNLYKSVYGNQIIFEEINHDLELSFRYRWSSSNAHGFVRDATLTNTGNNNREIALLDGLLNLVPAGVSSAQQGFYSNLVDAYKRNELDETTGLGIYALSAVIVDKAEPSEALKANVVWATGIEPDGYLLSARKLDDFRAGRDVGTESDVRAEKGAFLLHKKLELAADDERHWTMVANVNKNHAGVARLRQQLRDRDALEKKLREDIARGTENLIALAAAADGLQHTADERRDTRHFANVLFNLMRGGTFDHNYDIERDDFAAYLRNASRRVYGDFRKRVADLPEVFTLEQLRKVVAETDNPDFRRLALEYLPLKFSRRHGDPSRPWNRFSINTTSEVDGSKILDYEGNWRDIFQNWEALAFAYPEFIEGMIFKFLNATTFDGYNPYRVTKGGFDWETIEPDDPWSYIGYWGDHQIIYLLKFLEFSEQHRPGRLREYFGQQNFVYADVPYRIKDYADLLADPKDTIVFDREADEHIRTVRDREGADGALLRTADGALVHVTFLEKILATVLSKLSNYIPGGGIWMNTQRPEWNDANNALVGNGVSMVTLYYLRRFLAFFDGLLAEENRASFTLSAEISSFLSGISDTLRAHENLLEGQLSDADRRRVLDGLGRAGEQFRNGIYGGHFSGDTSSVTTEQLRAFVRSALRHLDHTVAANRRADKLYHGYNLMTPTQDGVTIDHLAVMLEGQVAAPSLGNLPAGAVLATLDALRASDLYRPDQNSYILYPNKELPGFLEKNTLPNGATERSELLLKMVAAGDPRIVEKDVDGKLHWNAAFNNVRGLNKALDGLADTDYAELAEQERPLLRELYEEVFNHKEFTGRSGTFFGYEGLGSIYWHMVSKLQLAVQECCLRALDEGADRATTDRLVEHYYAISEGVGVHKDPEVYGAFPTDPYSHTPAGKGAQQPGMTGQVKEDILCRIGELGAHVADGVLHFHPRLLRQEELRAQGDSFDYVDVNGSARSIDLPERSLFFTRCQIPVIYVATDGEAKTVVTLSDGSTKNYDGTDLDRATSAAVFGRGGTVRSIHVYLPLSSLRE